MKIDRRTLMVGLAGMAGAGASFRCLRGDQLSQRGQRDEVARAQRPVRASAPRGLASATLAQVPLGAGGFVSGLDVSTDGSRWVCRTDVSNAYVREAAWDEWRPLFSSSSLNLNSYGDLPELHTKADGFGVAGIRIAPSNKDVIVASWCGFIWRSIDGGRSVKRTALPQRAMFANNGWQRLHNRTIDIHPLNSDRILVGTWAEGVWQSSDGGSTWSQVAVPESGRSVDDQPGINLVAFDPTIKDRVYVFVTGIGLCRSDDGPEGNFRNVNGGPTACSNLVVARNGIVWLSEERKDNYGRLWSYRPDDGWVTATTERCPKVVAIDPHNPNRIVATDPYGYFMSSNDVGRTWQTVGSAQWLENRGEVGWTRGLTTVFPAEIVFDPSQPGVLWIAQGVGVAKTDAARDGSPFRLEDHSAGIEELCMVDAVAPPGNPVVAAALDKPFWRLDNFGSYSNDFRYPKPAGRTHDPNLVAISSSLDFAGDDPNFLVGIVAPSEKSTPGFSTDGGRSWTSFKGQPATGWGIGGTIAASTKRNIVLLPSNNGAGVYTLDGGDTWSSLSLDGSTATGGFANAYYVQRKNIAADKSRPGTFALVYSVIQNDAFGAPFGGIWVTYDGGRTWQQKLKGVISEGSHEPIAVRFLGSDERQFWQCQLSYVPGHTGELVYTPHADYKADRFYWSRDDGNSWSELNTKVRNVVCFGFGKGLPGRDRPAVYFWGEVSGRQGLYVSLDWFGSDPTLITSLPSQMLSKISFITASPDQFGRAYVGTSCAGVVRVDLQV